MAKDGWRDKGERVERGVDRGRVEAGGSDRTALRLARQSHRRVNRGSHWSKLKIEEWHSVTPNLERKIKKKRVKSSV